MQNKGAITLLAVLLFLVCAYQLSFTWVTRSIESDADEYSKGDPFKANKYLDSLSDEKIYLGYTLRECREREINLGLDLKGGMNVTLEVSVPDVIMALSNYSKDAKFLRAMQMATDEQKISRVDFITLFGNAFTKVDPNAKLASVFATLDLKDRINYQTTNDEVLKIIRKEADDAIKNSYQIIRNRIDRFGITQPNVQNLENSGRILVELPGVKEPERVRKLLQGTASLEFWETYENKEVIQSLIDANKILKDINKGLKADSASKDTSLLGIAATDTTKKDTTKKETSLLDEIKKDTSKVVDTLKQKQQELEDNPLFAILRPNLTSENQPGGGALVGYAHFKDTGKVNQFLAVKQVKALFPNNIKFLWGYKPMKQAANYYELVAIKMPKDGKAPLDGSVVTNARPEMDQARSNIEVSMTMNGEGAKGWARLTKANIGRQVAIVLDNYVYSYPVVNSEITGGRSSISGTFTIEEATDLANVLKSGKLPAPARIIEEAVVGPSLGKEAIRAGLLSLLIAFVGVLLYMSLYYNRAGNVANLALFANVFFTFGVMASLGAVLTLPGLAGMVLTFAMAVDSNVIIYERMREEMRAGKGMQLIVKDGFWHALSAIIDGHITTILTGIVLFIFGSGPVQGFATVLVIGLVLSLFTSILVARLIFEFMLKRQMKITLGNKYTINAFTKIKIDFIGIRKKLYVVSGIVIAIGIVSLFYRGMSYGVDFTGGRTYIVRFDRDVATQDVRSSLKLQYNDAPEVKTFGPNNQVKITTKYLIDQNTPETDSLVEQKLYEGVKGFYKTPVTFENFTEHKDGKMIGRMSSQKVGPTVANDLIYAAFMAVFFGLIIIFIYITIRFRNWQFGLGGVISLFHDTMIVITMFTLFHNILPFSLEVDQSFIAALLTIIGYSIMDTVIIFDRIREYRILHPKWELKDNINAAINSTLGRTINTSGITLVVLICIFIFGGEILRGFIFALLVGVAVGTYSSVFNATPVSYDIIMWGIRRKERKALKALKTKK